MAGSFHETLTCKSSTQKCPGICSSIQSPSFAICGPRFHRGGMRQTKLKQKVINRYMYLLVQFTAGRPPPFMVIGNNSPATPLAVAAWKLPIHVLVVLNIPNPSLKLACLCPFLKLARLCSFHGKLLDHAASTPFSTPQPPEHYCCRRLWRRYRCLLTLGIHYSCSVFAAA